MQVNIISDPDKSEEKAPNSKIPQTLERVPIVLALRYRRVDDLRYMLMSNKQHTKGQRRKIHDQIVESDNDLLALLIVVINRVFLEWCVLWGLVVFHTLKSVDEHQVIGHAFDDSRWLMHYLVDH